MMKKLTLAATAMALTATGLAATPAAAQRYDHSQSYAYDQAYRDGYNRDDVEYRGDYRDDRRYDQGDYRRYDQRDYRRQYQDRRYYSQAHNRCRSDQGTIIGAIAGGLLGHVIAGRGDRTLGAVVGAGGGALAGRAIERDGCR